MSLSTKQLSAMHLELMKLGAYPEAAATAAEDTVQQEVPEPREAPPQKPPHPLLTAGKYLGAYGLGTGLGYAGMYGVQKLRGQPFSSGGLAMHAIPALTGLGGLAFTHAQNMMFEQMKEDALKRRAMSGK